MVAKIKDERIILEPSPVISGGKVKIAYRGLLKNAGANEVYLHYGFDGWKDRSTVKMSRSPGDVFITEIKAVADEKIDFCFKDSAGNWDNNSGQNWICEII